VDGKRNENAGALERVRAVNAEVIGMINRGNLYTSQRKEPEQGRGYSRGNQHMPQHSGNEQPQTYHGTGQLASPHQPLTLEQENMALRQ
jgi:hypothetical protein